MSDTEVTEVTEAPAPKVDHGQVLGDAFIEMAKVMGDATEMTPEQISVIQDVYREIPPAARGRAQGTALKAVITAGYSTSVEALLDATTSLPKAAGVGKPRKQLDPVTSLAIAAAATLVAFADICSDPEVGPQVSDLAKTWYNGEAPDEHKEAILRAAAAAVKAASKRSGRGGGAGGTRRTFTETLKDLIDRGDVKVGAKLTCATEGVTAKVLKTGEVQIGDTTYPNLSAAAKVVVGPDKSVNGWGYFHLDDKPIGDLRKG